MIKILSNQESAQQIYIQTLNQLMLSVMEKRNIESILQPVLTAMESFFKQNGILIF